MSKLWVMRHGKAGWIIKRDPVEIPAIIFERKSIALATARDMARREGITELAVYESLEGEPTIVTVRPKRVRVLSQKGAHRKK